MVEGFRFRGFRRHAGFRVKDATRKQKTTKKKGPVSFTACGRGLVQRLRDPEALTLRQ